MRGAELKSLPQEATPKIVAISSTYIGDACPTTLDSSEVGQCQSNPLFLVRNEARCQHAYSLFLSSSVAYLSIFHNEEGHIFGHTAMTIDSTRQ